MAQKIKVGVIGVGTIGSVHADAYQNCKDAELTALCDINAERLESQGIKFNVQRRFKDYRELLRSDVDAVSICVGNALHREVAVAALQANKHVLLEKPMAMNSREAAEIVAASRKTKRVTQIAMVQRQRPDVQLARQHVQAGLLGNIYHIRSVLIRRRGIPGLGGWFTTKADSGGGPLIDIGVHWFDVAMFVSGLWNPASVSAMTYAKFGAPMKKYRYVGMWAGPPNFTGVFNVEDYASGFVRFGKAATMSFEMAWAANAEDEAYVEFLGDKGGVRVLDGKPFRLLTEHENKIADIFPKFDDRANVFHLQAQKFIAACRGECPPVVTAREGWINMKLIDAVYASGKSGSEVKITLD